MYAESHPTSPSASSPAPFSTRPSTRCPDARHIDRPPRSNTTTITSTPGDPALRVPAYRLHRAKGLAYVRLAGQMVYLGRAGSAQSHERYRRTVAEWLATGRAPRRSADEHAGPTVATLVDAYLAWARGYYVAADGSPSPGLGPVEAASRALCYLYGSTAAADFGPVALRAVREAMVVQGLCRNVVNQRIACVKRIFRWAVAEELVPPGVMQALAAVGPLRAGRSGARETPPVRPVPDAHVDATVPFLPPTLAAMVRLQRLTGMRSGEVCVMRTCDVDASGEVWVYRPATHKTAYRGHARVVYFGPQARAVLAPFLRPGSPRAFVFTPARAMGERRRLRRGGPCKTATAPDAGAGCPDEPDEQGRYTPRSYRRALCYAMDAAVRAGAMTEGQHWHPHQLRHLHGTAVRGRKGLEAARLMLGHRTLSQAADYAEPDAAAAMAIARELG